VQIVSVGKKTLNIVYHRCGASVEGGPYANTIHRVTGKKVK